MNMEEIALHFLCSWTLLLLTAGVARILETVPGRSVDPPPSHAKITHTHHITSVTHLLTLASQSVALGLHALVSSLAEGLVLGTLGIHLLLEGALTLPLSLGPLDLHIR